MIPTCRRKHNTKLPNSIILIMAGLLLVFFSINLTGCRGEISILSKSKSSGPFFSDRVITVRILTSDEDWKATLKNPREENYVKANLWLDNELVPDVAVRPKGNSSLNSVAQSGSVRMSLKIDLNFFNDARSFKGVKKLNLNNGFSDPSLMREALSYELFEEMGVPTPRFSFVDLWINETHLGVYTMVEQIEKAFLSDHFVNDKGNLYKPEAPGAYLNWTEADLSSKPQATDAKAEKDDFNIGGGKLSEIEKALGLDKSAAVTPVPDIPIAVGNRLPGQPGFPGMGQRRGYLESMGLKTNEGVADHKGLLNFLEILNKEPAETFQKEIEKVLDVDGVLRYLAVCTALVHLDNYSGQFAHNYYLYEVDGKFSIIPWDLNQSFGGFSMGLDRQKIINFYIDEPTSGPPAERPLISKLLAVPAYLETYHNYLEEIVNGPFATKVMNAKIDTLAKLIRPYVEKDTLKFYSTTQFEKSLGDDVNASTRLPGMGINVGLKAFVAQRGESIKNQLAGKITSKSIDGSGNGGRMNIPPGNQGNQLPMFPPNQGRQ